MRPPKGTRESENSVHGEEGEREKLNQLLKTKKGKTYAKDG
jgi:hypothetical protein